MPRLHRNQSGAGLIVVVLILLVVGMVIAAFVSLVNTESFTATGQTRGLEAFYIAEGGIQYNIERNKNTGRLTIGDDFDLTYTGKTATTFTGMQPIPHPVHNLNDSVYPAAKLSATISSANCNDLAVINVNEDTQAFDISLPFFIDSEYFSCAAKTQFQFQTCRRCYLGSSKASHNTNSYASQYILTSTGRVTNILSGDAQRVVQVSAGPE
ncbi:MAG: hypothetical protein HY204_07935 [Nitrospirae bacterium]|nr:hypothetical protein [Nitrospirota bacterium]